MSCLTVPHSLDPHVFAGALECLFTNLRQLGTPQLVCEFSGRIDENRDYRFVMLF